MSEYLEKARDELKRSDHLVFVSLKYTRTCDVLHNTIQRLINAYDFAILAALEKAKSEGKIDSIPSSKKLRAELVSKFKKILNLILKLILYYLKLVKLSLIGFQNTEKE